MVVLMKSESTFTFQIFSLYIKGYKEKERSKRYCSSLKCILIFNLLVHIEEMRHKLVDHLMVEMISVVLEFHILLPKCMESVDKSERKEK